MENVTLSMYPVFVSRLIKDMGTEKDNLMHPAIGIAGEAGELLDAIKKHWAYNKPLDIENVIEELGDLEFYIEALRQEIGIDRDEILTANIRKLSARYHKGTYSDEQAQARADKTPEQIEPNRTTIHVAKCDRCGHSTQACNERPTKCYNCGGELQ